MSAVLAILNYREVDSAFKRSRKRIFFRADRLALSPWLEMSERRIGRAVDTLICLISLATDPRPVLSVSIGFRCRSHYTAIYVQHAFLCCWIPWPFIERPSERERDGTTGWNLKTKPSTAAAVSLVSFGQRVRSVFFLLLPVS